MGQRIRLYILATLTWLTAWAVAIGGGLLVHLFYQDATPLFIIVLFGCAVAASGLAHRTKKDRYDA